MKQFRREFMILYLDFILILSMWLILKLIRFLDYNTSVRLSNSIFDFVLFILYLIGFVYSLKVSFKLVKSRMIRGLDVVVIHFFLLLCFTLISFTIIFKNPDSDNYLKSTTTNLELGDNESDFNNWFNSLYFSANTIIGGGYGDIVPIGSTFRILAVFEMIIGWIVFTVLFSETVSYILNHSK